MRDNNYTIHIRGKPYEIDVAQTGSETIPLSIRVPVRAIRALYHGESPYRGFEERFPKLSRVVPLIWTGKPL